MGLFYTNVILYKVQQQSVANFLSKQGRSAYVSPTLHDFTVVYDKETEDQDIKILKQLCASLTKKFECAAWASLIHDSDVYMYWLYHNGKLLDAYNSLPDYFDSEMDMPIPEGGDAEKLCNAFGKISAISEIQKIFKLVEQGNLDEDAGEYLQGEDIHSELIKVLEMPSFGAFTGYYTIEDGDLPEGLQQDNLIKIESVKSKWFWQK
jgi:hypothetical protein